jgi:DNA-directed RNA polymerase alpha subunit
VPARATRITLAELGFSGVLIDCLELEGITTAWDLCHRTAEELLEVRNLGKKRLQEIRDRLAAARLWLWGEKPRGDESQRRLRRRQHERRGNP